MTDWMDGWMDVSHRARQEMDQKDVDLDAEEMGAGDLCCSSR